MQKRYVFLSSVICSALLAACATTSGTSSSVSASSASPSKVDLGLPKRVTHFVADTSPMPAVDLWLSAAKGGNVDAQFVASMMYRDEVAGVEHIVNGEKSVEQADIFKEMIRWWFKAEEEHSVLADLSKHPSLQYELSVFSECPKSGDVLTWLNTAADHGLPNAEFVLGLMYYNGVCVDKDIQKGYELIQRAAYHDLSAAQFQLGMVYELGLQPETQVDKKRANAWLTLAAEHGSIDAKTIMAIKYLDGMDVPVDAERAKDYIAKSHANHYWALLLEEWNFGNFDKICTVDYDSIGIENVHDSGCGDEDYYDDEDEDGEFNEEDEFEYEISKRAEASIPYSIDYNIANQWLYKNATNAHDHAMILRAQAIYNEGCKGEVYDDEYKTEQNNNVVLHLLEQSAASKHDFAFEAMAQYYFEEDDSERAMHYLEEMAKQNPSKEMYERLAMLYNDYSDDVSVDENLFRAYKYYRLAEMKEDALRVAFDIAEKFSEGEESDLFYSDEDLKDLIQYDPVFTIDEDDQKNALKWYSIAADGEYVAAYYALGKMYESGIGTKKDVSKAIELYKKYIDDYDIDFDYNMYYVDVTDRYLKLLKGQLSTFEDHSYRRWQWEVCRKLSNKCDTYKNIISKYPKLEGLRNAVDAEVIKEHDKSVDQFFIIKSGLKPCIQASKDNNYEKCESLSEELYKESIHKALRGIAALCIAKTGHADEELIVQTFYDLTILNSDRNYRKSLVSWSPVAAKIFDQKVLYSDETERLLKSWYMRQIPYAAKAIFDANGNNAKTWEQCLKEADQFMKDYQADFLFFDPLRDISRKIY